MVTQVAFWLSWALILACLLLCLQKRKRLVPFIRKTGPWGVGVPLVSVVLTLALFWGAFVNRCGKTSGGLSFCQ